VRSWKKRGAVYESLITYHDSLRARKRAPGEVYSEGRQYNSHVCQIQKEFPNSCLTFTSRPRQDRVQSELAKPLRRRVVAGYPLK